MKRLTAVIVSVLGVLSVFGALSAAEAQGNRQGVPAGGTCEAMLSSPAFSLAGVVSEAGDPGSRDGITVTAESGEDVILYGLGPTRYWEGLEIDKPVVGDVVQIDGKVLTIGETVRNIIVNLTYEDGSSIQLRDAATGCPLWRMTGKRTKAPSAN